MCIYVNNVSYVVKKYMARIICIDYGLKRTGLAVTDPLQIIATGLTTIDSGESAEGARRFASGAGRHGEF